VIVPPDLPLAVVLVAAVDRRVLPAVAFLPQLVGTEAVALHVAMDQERSYRLARDWMDLGVGTLPLQVEEPEGRTLAAAVRGVIEREARVRPRVTVVVPEMDLGKWWQPLLHRSTGRAVAWELTGLARVTTVVVPVRVDLPARSTQARY
jgi:hypothetical protein